MPSRTPIEAHGWKNMVPLPPEKFGEKPAETANLLMDSENTEPDGEIGEKQYGYEQNFHLGCYKTYRPEDLAAEKQKTMGIGAIFDKNKTNDGMSVPLTYPTKEKRNKLANLRRLFTTVVRDWIFLALLGFIMAALSFGMDYAILHLQNGQMLLFELVEKIHLALSMLVWVGYVVGLTVASALFAHYIAPQAIGSGIPEMKTILRGVILKEYLSMRTLISKMIGLTLSLGSGLPMGKEGPFVHVASVVASQLSRLVHGSSSGIFENETRSAEMLAAGCAVGVACTFSAPIGGVLFSIEVTSVYFAVRNYWRGFFAATCSATLFRILRMFSVSDSVTVEAHYQTNFPPQNAFMPQELPVFALIGLVCGLLGSAFVLIHRRIVLFLRRNSIAKMMFQKYWLIYPICVSIFISSLTFPLGLGQYMGGQERFSHTMMEFFVNCTWTAEDGSVAACPPPIVDNVTSSVSDKFDIHHWKGPNMDYSPFVTLTVFQFVFFFLAILSSTLPVPSGIFMPVFVLGAAFGRLVGEGVYQIFPAGFIADDEIYVRPGIYAVVGAAAFCGAVTHTVSVAVIVFELTGQLCALLPVMIAVLIANAIASYLQPSVYDSIIRIKNLPYLPDIPHTSSLYHQMLIEQFMIYPVIYISRDSTIGEVKQALYNNQRIRSFPLVESKESLALVGSVTRSQLMKMIDTKIGTKARFVEATKRIKMRMEEEERQLKEEQEEASQAAATPRKASRFLVVPLNRESTKNEKKGGLKPEVARKILTDGEKEALFDGTGKTMEQVKSDNNMDQKSSGNNHQYHTIGDIFRSITNLSFGRQNVQKKNSAVKNEFDLYGEERLEWENSVLSEMVDLSEILVDSTPFQLSEYTSLIKVHSLFSLLGLNRAYVTKKGQLIGVVALKELRSAIEFLQAGKVPIPGENIFNETLNASLLMMNTTTTTTSFDRTPRLEGGGQNGGFVDDNGEDDADDDYIHPPIEVLRRGALTPCLSNQKELEEDIETVRAVTTQLPQFEISSTSTNTSCVSIELPAFRDEPPEPSDSELPTSDSGLVLCVPSLQRPPSRTCSEEMLMSPRSVKIRMPSQDQDDDDTKL